MERKAKAGLSLVFLVVVVLLGRGLAFQNEPKGFRDLKWGDPPLEAMKYVTQIDGDNGYVLPDDKMQIGNCQLSRIIYIYWKNRLYMVGCGFQGQENFDVMKMICLQRFGKVPEELFDIYNWEGQVTSMTLQYDNLEGTGFLGFTSTLLNMERNQEEEKKEAEKAEGDW